MKKATTALSKDEIVDLPVFENRNATINYFRSRFKEYFIMTYDFRDVAKHLAKIQEQWEESSETSNISTISEYYKEKAAVRELDSYLNILRGA